MQRGISRVPLVTRTSSSRLVMPAWTSRSPSFAHQGHAGGQGRGPDLGFGRAVVDLRADGVVGDQQLKHTGAPGE
jgi:hypothetical protein